MNFSLQETFPEDQITILKNQYQDAYKKAYLREITPTKKSTTKLFEAIPMVNLNPSQSVAPHFLTKDSEPK